MEAAGTTKRRGKRASLAFGQKGNEMKHEKKKKEEERLERRRHPSKCAPCVGARGRWGVTVTLSNLLTSHFS